MIHIRQALVVALLTMARVAPEHRARHQLQAMADRYIQDLAA